MNKLLTEITVSLLGASLQKKYKNKKYHLLVAYEFLDNYAIIIDEKELDTLIKEVSGKLKDYTFNIHKMFLTGIPNESNRDLLTIIVIYLIYNYGCIELLKFIPDVYLAD